MLIDRNITGKLHWIFDNLLPPILSDNRWFMGVLAGILYGDKKDLILDFRKKAPFLTNDEFREYYRIFEGKPIKKPTDLNDLSLNKILSSITGTSVLDVGCGRGFLTEQIIKKKPSLDIAGVDVYLIEKLKQSKNPHYVEGFVEKLPFKDHQFDTVICTHVLEHVQNVDQAICELRRVTKKRLIIIVPRQREYMYSLDLHINFFPYPYSLQKVMNNKGSELIILDNDLYYQEDK